LTHPFKLKELANLCAGSGEFMVTLTTSLVATGFGVSLVPASSQLLRSAGVVYRPLQGTTPTMDLAVTWLPEKLTPVTQNFLQVARETV